MDYFSRANEYADSSKSPRPGLILLDLNLPGIGGHKILKYVKGHKDLKYIPVIIMTGSVNEKDILECYGDGANAYLKKPVHFQGFMETIQRLKDFWIELAFLPKLSK